MTSQWFGDYEIIKRLRVGGMATLYLARRHGAAGFSRLVALKLIHPSLVAQSSFLEMFVDEARICSQISHPNVVHVEEFGVIHGTHYLAMEYLDGCSISELLQVFRHDRRTLDPELAARVVAQIASGLHAAHETRDQDGQPLEIIHRDISPSNVLLSVAGNAKLIDFGIAKARRRLSETQAGVTLKGKYRYVAPEQAMRRVVDRRCDVFSLGVLFWEMLVGQPLFPDDSAVALFSRLHETNVPPPSTVNPAVPVILDPIVLAMVEHDPARRPQTAAEVERRIVLAAPGAANREASELGTLAIEVRDRRAAWQAARRRAGKTSDLDSPVSSSPTPRSAKGGSDGSRDNHELTNASDRPASAIKVPLPMYRDPHTVLLGVAVAIVLAAIGGVLLGRGGGEQRARATVPHDEEQPPTSAPGAGKSAEASGVLEQPAGLFTPPGTPSAPAVTGRVEPASVPPVLPSGKLPSEPLAPWPPVLIPVTVSTPAQPPPHVPDMTAASKTMASPGRSVPLHARGGGRKSPAVFELPASAAPPAAPTVDNGPGIIKDFDEQDPASGQLGPVKSKPTPIIRSFDELNR